MQEHEIKSVDRDFGYCGSHYCTGHWDHYIVCSCGFEEEYYGDFIEAVAAHKEAVISKVLDITFKVRNT